MLAENVEQIVLSRRFSGDRHGSVDRTCCEDTAVLRPLCERQHLVVAGEQYLVRAGDVARAPGVESDLATLPRRVALSSVHPLPFAAGVSDRVGERADGPARRVDLPVVIRARNLNVVAGQFAGDVGDGGEEELDAGREVGGVEHRCVLAGRPQPVTLIAIKSGGADCAGDASLGRGFDILDAAFGTGEVHERVGVCVVENGCKVVRRVEGDTAVAVDGRRAVDGSDAPDGVRLASSRNDGGSHTTRRAGDDEVYQLVGVPNHVPGSSGGNKTVPVANFYAACLHRRRMVAVECAIVGGGIAGASVAYSLAQRGVDDVVLFERGEIASEMTKKSFALFGMYGDRTQFRLKRHGMAVYNEFARENPDITYDRIGHLSVGTTPETREKFQRAIVEGTDVGGIFATGSDRTAVRYLDGNEIEERLFIPQLDTSEVTSAVYRPGVGYFNQVAIVETLLERAADAGVEVREHALVEDLHVEDGAITGLTVDGERIGAESVVVAAGPWTPDVAEKAGVDLPVRHSLAPVLVADAGETSGTLPSLKHHESNYNFRGNAADGTVWIGNHADGYEGGERIDPDAVPSSVADETRQGARDDLERFLPSLADAPVVDEWVGVRSLTPDGNPIAGWTAVDGLSVIAFNTSGIQLSPGIGNVVATQLVDSEPTSYYDALSVTRFEGYQDAR